jgi:hypothetical protein
MIRAETLIMVTFGLAIASQQQDSPPSTTASPAPPCLGIDPRLRLSSRRLGTPRICRQHPPDTAGAVHEPVKAMAARE